MTRINTNVSSLVAQNTLGRSNADLNQALTRLSTGLRINTGQDDPAGLIASENLRSDITSIRRAISNTDRANQVIATADSALGQVSSLLNDIRGLVTESANTGALSDEQIAANQLQVDSSLEALNRIAQTTTFQGRRLLDGSLDFLTSAGSNFTSVQSLQIDQANLGATGSVAVDIEVTGAATQAQIDISGIQTETTSAATVTTGAAATGDLSIDIAATAASNSIAFDSPATTASGSVAFASLGASFDVTADAAGAAGNDLVTEVNIVDGTAGNTLTAGVATINVDFSGGATATVDQIATAVGALSGITTDNVINGSEVITGPTADADVTLSGGADVVTDGETITFTSVATGEAIDLAINFETNDNADDTPVELQIAAATTTDPATLTVQVTDDTDETFSLQDIVDAINNSTTTGIDGVFEASTTSTLSFDGATALPTELNAFAASGSTDLLLNNGTDASTETISIETAESIDETTITLVQAANIGAAPQVTGNATDGFTVTIDNARTTSLAAIAQALQDDAGITSATSSDPTAAFVGGTDVTPTAPTTLTGETAGVSGNIGIDDAVVFELTGGNGSEVLSFGAGTTIEDLAAGINLVSDATGVQATVGTGANDGVLSLISTGFGSNEVVDVEIISEGDDETPAGVFTSALALPANNGGRSEGTDVVATINGVQANGNGTEVSINTATLDLTATLDSTFTGTASFTITGGGALFQLGPDVVSNQQARLGIGSVNTSSLGGVDGSLFQLGSGGLADLTSENLDTAAAIVEDAIDQVTSLRGRLGAFQRTTLETNQQALNDTLVNLTAAESSIRDADFAAESAALTRSQILVQSGTTVLQIANQNPQNVLALLG